jgi:hypothetical protein
MLNVNLTTYSILMNISNIRDASQVLEEFLGQIEPS